MNKAERARMKEYTNERVRDPQPGDHFTEMLGSVAFIEDRSGDVITLRRPHKHKAGEWGPSEHMSVREFIDWASYKTIPGYWLQCWPPNSDWPSEVLSGG